MNVDKFGHHIHKRMRLSELCRIDSDLALTKSDLGEYNLESTRMRGVREPLEADDVANKAYVDEVNKSVYTKTEIDTLLNSWSENILNVVFKHIKDLKENTSTTSSQIIKSQDSSHTEKRVK